MMKPQFSKPFNMEHARAGAPFCLRGGGPATVLKWDGRRNGEPLIGFRTEQDIPSSWSAGGVYFSDGLEGPDDLVMLPLGLIDGKPVFLGDEVLAAPRGEESELTSAFVGMTFPDGHAWKWPAPTKVYPEFSGDLDELRQQHNAAIGEEMGWRLLRVANFALRRAVDSEHVVLPGEVLEVARRLNKSQREAREMAIARAVLAECKSITSPLANIDLAAIIATIK
jgi:hypothetical protein